MKILITRCNEHETDHMGDLLIHGFTELGHDVVDAPRVWHVHADGKPGPAGKHRHELHGKGFTLTNILPNDSHIDRTDIESKIRNKYFDLHVLSRADFESPYEKLILDTCSDSKIITLDGKDQSDFQHYRDHAHLVGRGSYFKRELTFDNPFVHPIGFTFPKQKIIDRTGIVKEKIFSGAKPVEGDNATKKYMFDNEQEYYRDYAASYFGETTRKGGWDCMRHHEIMASGCVPWFTDLADCPEQTCTFLPKEDLLAVNQFMADNGAEWFEHGEGLDIYETLQERIFDHFLNHCTTEAMAKYVLDTHKRNYG
jgi:hypothetical protein